MRILSCFIFFVIFSVKVWGQCSPPASDNCSGAKILCSAQELNGLSCQTLSYLNSGGCNPLCSSGGKSYNTSWWAFTGYKGQICFTVNVTSSLNNKGMQYGLYGDYCCENNIFCEDACQTTGSITTHCFTVYSCSNYHFFVNGCDGDVCDFNVSVTGGAIPFIAAPVSLSGPTDICLGETKVIYNAGINKLICDSRNLCRWYLDGSIVGDNKNAISLEFPNEGMYNLCVSQLHFAGYSSQECAESALLCKQIKVTRRPMGFGPKTSLCEDLFPFLWGNTLIEGSGVYTSEFKVGNCFQDSTKTFISLPSTIDICKKNHRVSGFVYYDLDHNGTYNKLIDLSANGIILENDQSSDISVSQNGNYKLPLTSNEVNVIKAYVSAGTKNTINPKKYSIYPIQKSGDEIGNYDFAIQLSDSIDLEVILNVGRARSGKLVQATIQVNNLGELNVQDAELSLEFPLDWQLSLAIPNAIGINSNLFWNFNSTSIGRGLKFDAWFSIPGNTPANKKFQLKAKVNTALDKRISNNEAVFNDFIRNSFDPNDKLVQTIRDPFSESLIGDLLYTIRFQNTGNDTAYNVIIKDSLSNFLDSKTIRIVNSSHKCTLDMDALSLVNFNFKDILLPDSFVNEKASHGFVQFLIKPKLNVKSNDVIANRASIYFDGNTPIQTNQVSSSFVTLTNSDHQDFFIELIPNPVRENLLLKYSTPSMSSRLTAEIYSIDGKLRKQIELDNSGSKNIDDLEISKGMYFLKIQMGSEIVAYKKFIKM